MGPVTAPQHPIDQVRDEVAAGFLRQVWAEIEQRYSPQHVILFGSRATGTAQADSDVDLILVSPWFEGLEFAERTCDFLTEIRPYEYGLAVDALCYTPEEFKDMSTGIGMVAEAVKEGIWIR